MKSKMVSRVYCLFVILLAGLIGQSCSEEMDLRATDSPEHFSEEVINGQQEKNSLTSETYITNPQEVLAVLTANTYYVYFNDNHGPQQIAAIKFTSTSTSTFSITWTELSGAYTGTGLIETGGKVSMFVNFGGSRALKFGLLRVVDVYADPTHPYDVFFDKTQVLNGGGLNYGIDNVQYFDQVDPNRKDKQSSTPKPLENTQWNQTDWGVPPSMLEFRNTNAGFTLEYTHPQGEGIDFGTYSYETDRFMARVSFESIQDKIFLLQIYNSDNSRLMLFVEKKNGNLASVKKFILNNVIVM